MDLPESVELLLHSAGALVMGVSGGPDSLAMLHLFTHLREGWGLRLFAVHVNHSIRGEDAEADARYVERVCGEWGVPCNVIQADVPALARERRLTLEEAARQARYSALADEAIRVGATVIAVAHNADDQAETVLMHLLRGSGLAGLRGMLPVTPLSDYHVLDAGRSGDHRLAGLRLLRPLLGIPRAEIEAYCAAHRLEPRLDRSNLDTTYFRNRLRHEIIPLLETINPELRATLGRTAATLAADYEVLSANLDRAWQAVARAESSERIRLDRAAWQSLPAAMQRGVIRRGVWRLRANLWNVTFSHVEGAVRVGRDGLTGAQATLPGGLVLRVAYESLIIAPADRPVDPPEGPLLEPGTTLTLAAGETALPGSDWRISLRLYEGPYSGPDRDALIADRRTALLRVESDNPSMELRTRRRGDRFQPQGAGGTQKVADFMINARIPAAWRDHLPLLLIDGQIAWLCGWRVDQRFVVGLSVGKVWLIRFARA